MQIYKRLNALHKEEIENFRQFIAEHDDHVYMTKLFTNDDGEEEYYYSDDPQAYAMVRKQYDDNNDYCQIVVHEAWIDKHGTLWFLYSPYSDSNSYTEWDCEPIMELDFIVGQIEVVQEYFEDKYSK